MRVFLSSPGDVAEERNAAAEFWFRKAAGSGNTDAMFDLGRLLKERNSPDAETWLRKAAEAG